MTNSDYWSRRCERRQKWVPQALGCDPNMRSKLSASFDGRPIQLSHFGLIIRVKSAFPARLAGDWYFRLFLRLRESAWMRQLYRSMRSEGGAPKVERSARGLGVRLDMDVHPDVNGEVMPGEGMSVAPDDPFLLHPHRRPEEFGGDGRDPVWVIDEAQLVEDLTFSQDKIDHGVIGPATILSLIRYEEALAETRDSWKPCPSP